MRLMSFGLTVAQMQAGTKLVTRRVGWAHAKPGMLLQPVRKAMGLKKGEQVDRITRPIMVVDVRREPLRRMIDLPEYGVRELVLEGFPDYPGGAKAWCEWFIKSHAGADLELNVTRIRFEHDQELPR